MLQGAALQCIAALRRASGLNLAPHQVKTFDVFRQNIRHGTCPVPDLCHIGENKPPSQTSQWIRSDPNLMFLPFSFLNNYLTTL